MYQMNPPQPVQLPPQPENKRLSVPQIMLIVLVLGFVAWYLITTLTPAPERYGTITAGVIGSRYTGDCLLVRDETPYDAEGVTSVDYIAEEGSMVYRGISVCNVYSSGFSTREMNTLQDYRNQIKEYQIKLLSSEITTDTQLEKLASDVMTQAREVRQLIGGARGNMNNQESMLAAAISNRQNYLKSKYSEDQRMTRLYDDELSQLQRISSWTKQYAAMSEGLVSFYSDGYEYGLTVSNYDSFTPSEVRSMINGKKPETGALAKGKTTIYRIVRDGQWYVLMLIRDSNWNPVEGASYELKLENFKDTTVQATVTSFTRSGGELVVRLSVQAPVQPVLYVRTCTGVLGDSVSSLMVPARAIYYQDNMPGIVLSDNGYEWFIPVNILEKRDNMVFISAIQQGVLYEGQTVRLF
ncbi:MAG: hypothetical protein IJG94_09015 [Clostridia bacterium]|nr:hypothetical protein [Clostridia bacterium]MBR2853308.1 hypothetical protein [Clostridia bacterium]